MSAPLRNVGPLSDEVIASLRALAELVGYLRFFHPADEVGDDEHAARRHRRGRLASAQEFEERVDQWVTLLRGTESHEAPEIWSLGTGLRSAQRAAALGISYAFSLFHKQSTDDVSAFELYRTTFQPPASAGEPRTMLAFSGLCAETDADADRQIQSRSFDAIRPVIWGSAATCTDKLADFLIRYRPDELMLHDLSPSIEDKKESYRRWAGVVTALSS